MEGKVLLYDANDVKIGETFMRRARQLIKQQRASWIDEKQNAIRFAPGMENLDAGDDDVYAYGNPSATMTDAPSDTTTSPAGSKSHCRHDESSLISLAERRIYERKFFKLHSIVFIPGLFIVFILAAGIVNIVFTGDGALLFLGFAWGSWATAYGIHAYFYCKSRRFLVNTKDERKQKELEAELALLRAELGR